jgi:hypothetical protein
LRAGEDEVGDGRGRITIHAGDDMAVGLEGEGDTGVAQALAHHLGTAMILVGLWIAEHSSDEREVAIPRGPRTGAHLVAAV